MFLSSEKAIRQIRNYVTQEVMAQLVTSLVISRLDYCNSVLAGLPTSTLAPLQRVQNAAARLVLRLLQHCSSCTDCPSSTASSSIRLRRWCTTFYIMDVRRISSTCMVAFNTPDSHRRQFRSSHTRAAVVKRTRVHFVNAPSRLVVPTYGTVFLQQSVTLTVIQHLDELWSHIYSSVLFWHNFLSFFTCVSYAEARNRYICWTSVCLSVCHTLALYQNGWIYCQAFFTTR